jgi:hypothetical protein
LLYLQLYDLPFYDYVIPEVVSLFESSIKKHFIIENEDLFWEELFKEFDEIYEKINSDPRYKAIEMKKSNAKNWTEYLEILFGEETKEIKENENEILSYVENLFGEETREEDQHKLKRNIADIILLEGFDERKKQESQRNRDIRDDTDEIIEIIEETVSNYYNSDYYNKKNASKKTIYNVKNIKIIIATLLFLTFTLSIASTYFIEEFINNSDFLWSVFDFSFLAGLIYCLFYLIKNRLYKNFILIWRKE